jgi:hypothetical protein
VLGGCAALLVAVVVIAAAILLRAGPGAPPGTPNGLQLEQLLPQSQALAAGWRLAYRPAESASYVQAGTKPPLPINACYDFNTGFDLGIAGDTFVSSASETAYDGAGMLRIDLFGVLPGDGAKAISAVKAWAGQCSSYTSGPITYTVTAAAVPGLGDQSLDVRVTGQGSGLPGGVTDNNTLVVRVGSDLIAIECLAPSDLMISSLASLAAPMARKLPSAASLPVTAAPAPITPTPAKPAPAASPDLSDGQLQALLPTAGQLPAAYRAFAPDYRNDAQFGGSDNVVGNPPPRLACGRIPGLEGSGFLTFNLNDKNAAWMRATDADSDNLDVVLDEPTSTALAEADFQAFQQAAARCPTLTSSQTRYKTVVTSVPGLGNENVSIQMDPTSTSPYALGPQDMLLVRVGSALVLVDSDLSSPGEHGPSLVAIARPIVKKL